jgi:hypothetical protein
MLPSLLSLATSPPDTPSNRLAAEPAQNHLMKPRPVVQETGRGFTTFAVTCFRYEL